MTFLDPPRRRSLMSLTPMIDVVFLLLVFFILAARFGTETAIDVTLGGASGGLAGPPRLVDVLPQSLRLNGVSVTLDALPGELRPLLRKPEDVVVLTVGDETPLSRLVAVTDRLRAAGLTSIAIVGR